MYQGWQRVFFESKHFLIETTMVFKKPKKMPARVPIFFQKKVYPLGGIWWQVGELFIERDTIMCSIL